jgi:RNA polymerase sigma factor (sigma-70 family)
MPGGRSSLQVYLRALGRHPRLSSEDEQRLGRLTRDGGNPAAAAALVNAHLRTVVLVARSYRPLAPGIALLDLVQEGNLALVRAVRRFDPDRCGPLRAHATTWIRTYLDRYVAADRGRAPVELDPAPAREADAPDLLLEQRQLLARLSAALPEVAGRLSGRDLSVFRHRLLGLHPCTLAEEGVRLGISAERVRQIEDEITDQVRALVLGVRERSAAAA